MTEANLQRLCAAVSAERMMADLAEFARWIKLSGTPDELTSLRHVRAELDAAGFATTLLSHDAYISLPGAARLEVGLVGAWTPHAITHSFSRPSPEGGLTAEIVYVKSGAPADLAAADVRGRILLVDGIASPAVSLRASEAGAAGQIHISPHADPHEMCISPVWGSPTDEALARLPRTVVLSVGAADGASLKQRIAAGQRIQATLHAEVDTRWRETPVLVADLAVDGEAPFVLFSGHHDTWYYGVMDNGSANATMLEVARLLAPDRAAFRRGLRLCFWSGHSHGRYAGSTWYADNHWDELNRRCVAHVNVDSTGGLGASVLADVPVSAELRPLGREAVLAQGGQHLEGGRMARAGDESFWGIGLPSMYMCMGEQPADGQVSAMAGVIGNASKKSAGLGWWWHTPHDTLDKIDPDNLVRDTRVYVHTLWRLLTDAVLPFDYGETAADLGAELRALAGGLGGRFDLAPLLARVAALAAAAGQVGGGDPARVNAALMAAGRALVPLDYTTGDRFSHDPAIGQSPWPVLDKLRALAAAAPGSEAAKFLTVAARRASNRLGFALDQAIAALRAAS